MSSYVYCTMEVFDNKTNKWYAKDCSFVNLITRDFISGNNDFSYIFSGKDKLDRPKIYNCNGSDRVQQLMNTTEKIWNSEMNVYDDFMYYDIQTLRNITDKLSEEYYTRKLYDKYASLNELNKKADIIDFVKKGIDNNTDTIALKRLILKAEDDISISYSLNEIEDAYESMKYLIEDFNGLLIQTRLGFIDYKQNKIVNYDTIDSVIDDNIASIDEADIVRFVFYFTH